MPTYYTCTEGSTVTVNDVDGNQYAYLLCNPGDLQTLNSSDLEVAVYDKTSAPFDFTQIDAGIATDLFIGGFLLCITPWAAAYGASKILALLR